MCDLAGNGALQTEGLDPPLKPPDFTGPVGVALEVFRSEVLVVSASREQVPADDQDRVDDRDLRSDPVSGLSPSRQQREQSPLTSGPTVLIE
jgi:hypothetical protein